MSFANKLEKCGDFACIFDLVKMAVEMTTSRRRVGLILGLSDLPNHVGAFHQMGSNFIVMNRNLLERVIESENKKLINAYIFHILLHEYIHSLGRTNEQETSILTHNISEKMLGPDHPATLIARYGIGSVFSNIDGLEYRKPQRMGEIEIVKDFESDNLSYFG